MQSFKIWSDSCLDIPVRDHGAVQNSRGVLASADLDYILLLLPPWFNRTRPFSLSQDENVQGMEYDIRFNSNWILYQGVRGFFTPDVYEAMGLVLGFRVP